MHKLHGHTCVAEVARLRLLDASPVDHHLQRNSKHGKWTASCIQVPGSYRYSSFYRHTRSITLPTQNLVDVAEVCRMYDFDENKTKRGVTILCFFTAIVNGINTHPKNCHRHARRARKKTRHDLSHLFRSVANNAAEERLLQIRDDLAGADDHAAQSHHLVDVLRV